MEEILLKILEWLLAGGLGSAILWLTSGRVRRAETKQREQTAYEQMRQEQMAAFKEVQGECNRLFLEVNKLNQEVTNLHKENGKLQQTNENLEQAIDQLTRAVELVNDCIHRGNCPVIKRMPQLGSRNGNERGRMHGRDRPQRDARTGGGDEPAPAGGHDAAGDVEEPDVDSGEPGDG